MIKIHNLLGKVSLKTSKSVATKISKKTGENLNWLTTKLNNEIQAGLKTTRHFEERVLQRFSEIQEEELASALSRCLRQTKPLEIQGTTQKFVDEISKIVIVLERMGQFGATLVTSFILGQENLLSDEELYELKRKGILC